ncbi:MULTISPECIES: curli assembly protein CsgF [Pseudomonas]|uniref:Curli production assembly/transport component CsgF n=1 Tax=Pseudomonas flexibilis TaxID=706570 RepID=A0A1N6TS47_9PSED|nr:MULTISPECIES: curli assembly protein CsgF [Pseudomonas]KHL69934.1 curli production assembly protein CsgF [Pseudomonas flexibilis]SIQ56084.1 curli production assembly/transport component CsgF [Pseudomonas flexibilis]
MRGQWSARFAALGLACSGLLASVQASELVYTPINPSFGGNPLNGGWLLGNAQAQNDHSAPGSGLGAGYTGTTALERFTSQLESRLLSQLMTNIESGQTGTLTTSAFIIEIQDNANSGILSILVTDRVTGEVSEIVLSGWTPN